MTSTSAASRILGQLYGIDAELTRLYGEFDDNFLAVARNGEKRILKVMHAGCPVARIDLQCRALEQLSNNAPELNIPRVIPASGGQPYSVATVGGSDRVVWLLRYCEGTLLEHVTAHTNALIRSFGRTLALLDVGLGGFVHPAMRPGHEWELTRAPDAIAHLPHVFGEAKSLIADVLGRFDRETLGRIRHLPHSVIHNDANDGNVLVNISADGAALVDGMIDFGDISYQPTVCDVGIALAYVVINKDDPLSSCARFLEGYNSIRPLSGDEIAVLFDMITARLAVSVAIAAGRRSKNPDDPVGSQDKGPATRALALLAGISGEEAQQRFREACAGRAN